MSDRSMLWLPISPEPWRRTRGSGRGRYTDQRSRSYAELIGWELRAAGVRPASGPLRLELVIRPTQIGFELTPGPPRPRILRADIDNYAKGIADAAQGVAYDDDRQITELVIRLEEE